MLVDVEGVFAEQVGRHRLVEVGLDRLGAEEGFPQAADAFVSMHPHPDEVRELPEPQRFDFRDLHGALHGSP